MKDPVSLKEKASSLARALNYGTRQLSANDDASVKAKAVSSEGLTKSQHQQKMAQEKYENYFERQLRQDAEYLSLIQKDNQLHLHGGEDLRLQQELKKYLEKHNITLYVPIEDVVNYSSLSHTNPSRSLSTDQFDLDTSLWMMYNERVIEKRLRITFRYFTDHWHLDQVTLVLTGKSEHLLE